jgi:hypothetical protein
MAEPRAMKYADIVPAKKTVIGSKVVNVQNEDLDTLNSFPDGAGIALTIYHAGNVFKALGEVVYVLPNMGMGVSFTKVEPQDMQVLLAWLDECAGSPPTT